MQAKNYHQFSPSNCLQTTFKPCQTTVRLLFPSSTDYKNLLCHLTLIQITLDNFFKYQTTMQLLWRISNNGSAKLSSNSNFFHKTTMIRYFLWQTTVRLKLSTSKKPSITIYNINLLSNLFCEQRTINLDFWPSKYHQTPFLHPTSIQLVSRVSNYHQTTFRAIKLL